MPSITGSVHSLYGQNFFGAARGRRGPGLGITGLLWSLQMTLSCWGQYLQHGFGQKVICPLCVGGVLLSQAGDSWGLGEREIEMRIGAASAFMFRTQIQDALGTYMN